MPPAFSPVHCACRRSGGSVSASPAGRGICSLQFRRAAGVIVASRRKPLEYLFEQSPAAMTDALSGGDHAIDFGDDLAQMKRLGEHLGLLWRVRRRMQCDGRETGDEHDLERLVQFHGALGKFDAVHPDRKSTRLNSSHPSISYAVFCLKKKKTNNQ